MVRCKYSKCTFPPPPLSFYTWDALLGINIDLLFLFIDTLLFLGILVGMDSGFIQRHVTEAKYKAGLFFKVGERVNEISVFQNGSITSQKKNRL